MTNVGSADRMVRFVVGIVLAVAVFVPQLSGYFGGWGNWKYVLTAVGVVLIVTAALRICPAYSVFGISTAEKS